jgi:hypothetical protein
MTAPTFDGSFAHNWTAEILPNRPMILPARHYVYPAAVDEVELGALEVLIQSGNPPPPTDEYVPKMQPFLATCALGFRDPATPTGIWAMPDPDWLCAASGGYVYLIDATKPETFIHLRYRPVLEIRTYCPSSAKKGAQSSTDVAQSLSINAQSSSDVAQSLSINEQSLSINAQSLTCDAQSVNSDLGQSLILFISHHTILAWGVKGEAWESERLSSEGITVEGIVVEDGIPKLRGQGWDLMTDKDTPFTVDLRTGSKI